MRLPRIKPTGVESVYHCTSHLVAEAAYLVDEEKAYFVKRMKRLARFCGVFVVDYSVMSNHFHLVVRTPENPKVGRDELYRRLCEYYGGDTTEVGVFLEETSIGSRLGEELTRKYLQRMGDVSVFVKELKEGFTRFYNKRHARRGVLWSARFGSEIVENVPSVVKLVCGYVDLNSVRAWLVDDPKDYPFCGYAAALAGDASAMAGLQSFLQPGNWKDQASEYRVFLFGESGRSNHSSKRVIAPESIERVGKCGGELELYEVLRLKIRYFTDGGAIGTSEFVEDIWKKSRARYNPSRRTGARRMKGPVWAGLCTMRDLRKEVYSWGQKP